MKNALWTEDHRLRLIRRVRAEGAVSMARLLRVCSATLQRWLDGHAPHGAARTYEIITLLGSKPRGPSIWTPGDQRDLVTLVATVGSVPRAAQALGVPVRTLAAWFSGERRPYGLKRVRTARKRVVAALGCQRKLVCYDPTMSKATDWTKDDRRLLLRLIGKMGVQAAAAYLGVSKGAVSRWLSKTRTPRGLTVLQLRQTLTKADYAGHDLGS